MGRMLPACWPQGRGLPSGEDSELGLEPGSLLSDSGLLGSG